jgi:hypothetical protein
MNILKKADELTARDRNADYGHPLDDFTRTAALVNAMYGTKFKAEDIAIIQICVKLSRQANRYKLDNLTDICGYARTIQMCDDERWKRGKEIV